jgi:hypothetical protein
MARTMGWCGTWNTGDGIPSVRTFWSSGHFRPSFAWSESSRSLQLWRSLHAQHRRPVFRNGVSGGCSSALGCIILSRQAAVYFFTEDSCARHISFCRIVYMRQGHHIFGSDKIIQVDNFCLTINLALSPHASHTRPKPSRYFIYRRSFCTGSCKRRQPASTTPLRQSKKNAGCLKRIRNRFAKHWASKGQQLEQGLISQEDH